MKKKIKMTITHFNDIRASQEKKIKLFLFERLFTNS